MRRATIGVLGARAVPHSGRSRARPGCPASVVEPLGPSRTPRRRCSSRPSGASETKHPGAHRRDHFLREEEHVARPPGGLHGGLRLPGCLLLRQRRPRIHGRRVARRSLARVSAGRTSSPTGRPSGPARPRRARSGRGPSPSRPRPTRSTSTQEALPRPGHRGAGQLRRSPRSSSRMSSPSARRPSAMRRFATGAADREWAAMYLPDMLLLSKLGYADVQKLYQGELSWKDPRVVEVFLDYYKGARRPRRGTDRPRPSPACSSPRPTVTSTRSRRRACSRWGSWEHRAAPSSRRKRAGSPRASSSGLLNHPLMKDGKGHGEKMLGVAGSLAASRRKSPNLPLGHRGRQRLRARRDGQHVDGQDRHPRRASRPNPGGSTAPSSGTSTSSPR